jgi:hypothetical protein
MVVNPCNPSYSEGRGRNIEVPDRLGQKHETYLKKKKRTKSKKSRGHGSSGTVPSKPEALSSILRITTKKSIRINHYCLLNDYPIAGTRLFI